MKRAYTIFVDYNQFYLWDMEASPVPPTVYTELDVSNRTLTSPHVVVIQPERNMDVPVELETFDTEPDVDFPSWDHIAEASLDLPSGKLEIHECLGGSIDRITLTPGTYRVRALFGGLGEISDDGLEGNDHYKLQVWPAAPAPVVILKQFIGPVGG